jgi:hypothetical protein
MTDAAVEHLPVAIALEDRYWPLTDRSPWLKEGPLLAAPGPPTNSVPDPFWTIKAVLP